MSVDGLVDAVHANECGSGHFLRPLRQCCVDVAIDADGADVGVAVAVVALSVDVLFSALTVFAFGRPRM